MLKEDSKEKEMILLIVAIKGIGIFSKASKEIQGPEELEKYFQRVIELCNNRKIIKYTFLLVCGFNLNGQGIWWGSAGRC